MPAVKPQAPLTNIIVGGPMEMISMDCFGPLAQTNRGNKHLLVVTDYYTKWVEGYALLDQKATTVAQVLVDEVFKRFEIPAILHSDQWRNFESKIIQEVCKLPEIKRVRATPYHPQCDGLVERLNRTILDLLEKTRVREPTRLECMSAIAFVPL